MDVVKAPEQFDSTGMVSVFLAGSIEMGKAEDWQTKLTTALADNMRLVVLNPRRDDWDSTWVQEKTNPQFNEQVTWELDGQDEASVIAMYFDPATKSPITLLELGLYARHPGLVVFCPKGFWRKGNVDIVCDRHGVTQADNWTEFVSAVRQKLANAENKKLASIWGT